MASLKELTAAVSAPRFDLGPAAQERLDNLTKPQGSLGRLEDLARQMVCWRGDLAIGQPKPAAAVFAADHGVALAGVSPFPREVTAQMIHNFLAGGAGINVLCRANGAEVVVVDVGVDHDFGEVPGLIDKKVARGTANLAQEPAMTLEQAEAAMVAGAEVAWDLIDQGHDLLIPGEMGIGNTTPSAALAAAFTGKAPADITGRGAGVDDAGHQRKIELIQAGLDLHQPDPADPLGTIAALGGLEIAAIAGYCLGAAGRGVPVLLDGVISTAGGLCATKLCPAVNDWFISGHASVEQAQLAMLEVMGLKPLLDLNLRLGEGTGAAVAIAILRSAVAMYNEMATFADAGVSTGG